MLLFRRASPFLLALGCCAASAHAATFTVDRTSDVPTAGAPGAGACTAAPDDCSLQGAIARANAEPGADTIVFGVGGVINVGGFRLPAIASEISITGAAPGGAMGVTLDGNQQNRIFQVETGANLTLANLALIGGKSDVGGAILNDGTLAISACTLSGNVGYGYSGGGAIYNRGALQILNSTLAGNSTNQNGGAIFNKGTLNIASSTLANNSATGSNGSATGGAIYHLWGDLSLTNSTISGNSAGEGGGLYIGGTATPTSATIASATFARNIASRGGAILNAGALTIGNTLLQQGGAHGISLQNSNFGGPNARITSLGFNISDDSNELGNPLVNPNRTDRVNTDARLGPLANNGGATQTHALLAGSPAIDTGNAALAADQRGIARPQGASADVGAFERVDETGGATDFVVTSTGDAVANDGQTSLREAINLANQTPGANTITFNVNGPIALAADLPALIDEASFVGPATIEATDPARTITLFTVGAGVKANFDGLTLRQNFIGIANSGTASVVNCASSGNGGVDIYAFPGGITFVRGCTLSGGGVFNRGEALLQNSTLSGDNGVINNGILNAIGCTFGAQNSGVINFQLATLVGCTLSGSARAISNSGTLTAFNCTLSGNQTAVSCGNNAFTTILNGTISGNAIGVTGSGRLDAANTLLVGNGQNVGVGGAVRNLGGSRSGGTLAEAGLDSAGLQNNGGVVKTIALLKGSPAINAGDNALVPAGFGQGTSQFVFVDTDARGAGFPRISGARVDIGAFEMQNSAPTVAPIITPAAPTTSDILSVNPNGQDVDGDALSYVYSFDLRGKTLQSGADNTFDLARFGIRGGEVIKISVVANDGALNSAPGYASVTVAAAPTADSVEGSVVAGQTIVFAPLTGTDPDGDGSALRFQIVGNVPAGVIASTRRDGNGQWRLTFRVADLDLSGAQVVEFVAINAAGLRSKPATATVEVSPASPPTVNDTNDEIISGATIVIPIEAVDFNGYSSFLNMRIKTRPQHGSARLRRDESGQWTLIYRSEEDYVGPDSVEFIAIDWQGTPSRVATASINVLRNDRPTVPDVTVSALSGQTIRIPLGGADTEDDPFVLRRVGNLSAGAARSSVRFKDGAWELLFQSQPDFVGTVLVQYIAVDEWNRKSAPATITIEVGANAPSAPSAGRANAPSGGGS